MSFLYAKEVSTSLSASCLSLSYFSLTEQRGGSAESHIRLDSLSWSVFKHPTILHFQAEKRGMALLCLLCCRAGVFCYVLTAELLSIFLSFFFLLTPLVPNLTGKRSIMLFGSVLTCGMLRVHCFSRSLSFPFVWQPHGSVVSGISLNSNVMCVQVPLVGHWVSTCWLFLAFRERTWLSPYLLRTALPEPTRGGEPVGGFSPILVHGFQSLSLWQLRWWISSRAAEDR